MPKFVEDCVKSLLKKGYDKDDAYAICNAQWKKEKKKGHNKSSCCEDRGFGFRLYYDDRYDE